MNLLPQALRRIPTKVYVAQIVGNAALFLCAAAWLRIPDSHVWQLLFSLLLGAALAIGFFCLHAKVIRSLRHAMDPVALQLGAMVLAVWTLLLYLPFIAAAKIDAGSNQRAGYWNSQLSAHARTTFTYERLSAWQTDLLTLLVWYIIPALLLPFIIETVSRRLSREAWRNAARCLGRWQHWLAIFIAMYIARWATPTLLEWSPGTSVWGEVASVLLRLAAILVIDVLLLTFAAALDAELLARSGDARGDTTP